MDTLGDPSLVLLSDQAASNATDLFGANYYSGVATPANQYGSITIGALTDDESGAQLQIRSSLDGQNGYVVTVLGPLSTPAAAEVVLEVLGPNTVLYNEFLQVDPGDVFTVAAVGSTIYLLQNGVVLSTSTDTTYTSGVVLILLSANTVQTDATITHFVMGAASGSTPVGGHANTIVAGYGTDISASSEVTTNPAGETNSNRTSIMGTNRGSRFIG